jgi:Na+-transporting methylmalonyl-CoA/oxaloacetate decarboxylase gamma subunit
MTLLNLLILIFVIRGISTIMNYFFPFFRSAKLTQIEAFDIMFECLMTLIMVYCGCLYFNII